MKIQECENGQIVITHENLTLIHTDTKGTKFNDCSIMHPDFCEIMPDSDERFKPLFITLINYKNGNY